MGKIKSINGLMKYLRDKHNMQISGSYHKRQLKSIGYFHGYKGYRYIKKPTNRIKFNKFDELMAIIQFDNRTKALLYPQVMFIETAIKGYALELILQEGNSENLSDIYANLMTDYKSYSPQTEKYKNAYKKRMETFNRIQNKIANSYASDNNIVVHYLKNDESVPIWAIFEIITLGEFGHLVSTLNLSIRKKISKDIGLNIAFDSNGRLMESIIFILKDLRNSIAHNNIIFDTRFKEKNINTTLMKAISNDTHINSITFNSITDYIVLVIYLLRLLGRNKQETNKIINEFIKMANTLKNTIPSYIYNQIILTNDIQKLIDLKSF